MTQEVANEGQETAQEVASNEEASAVNTEVAEQSEAEQVEETPEQKVERLEKERDALKKGVDRLKADKHRAQGETRAERAQRMQLEQAYREVTGQEQQRQDAPQDIEQEIARRVQKEKFLGEVEAIVERGKKDIKGFGDKLAQLAYIAPLANDQDQPTALLLEIKACDNPQKMIAYLADNPDVAEDLAGANRSQIARKLALIEGGHASSPKVSSAPAPIKPIGNRGTGTAKTPDKMSHEEYRLWRRSQGARW